MDDFTALIMHYHDIRRFTFASRLDIQGVAVTTRRFLIDLLTVLLTREGFFYADMTLCRICHLRDESGQPSSHLLHVLSSGTWCTTLQGQSAVLHNRQRISGFTYHLPGLEHLVTEKEI